MHGGEMSKIKEFRTQYEYTGLFCGCVPVYVNFDGMDGADMMTREFVPDCLIEIVSDVWDFIADCVGFEGGWKISRIRKNKHFTGEAK